jgi:hypothetical protein
MNIQSDVTLKSFNAITSSRINCVGYIPSNKVRKTGNTIKIRQDEHEHDLVNKPESDTVERPRNIDSLLDIDSSDEEELNNQDNFSLDDSSINSFESKINHEEQDTREATLWLGTQNGG